MSLLARLAPHVGGYKETIGTEALGLLLADAAAASALTSALQVGLPELPHPLRFVTQAGSGETRPDVSGYTETGRSCTSRASSGPGSQTHSPGTFT